MSPLAIIINIIYILISLVIIAVVLLQHGRSAGISGTIAGGAETFFGKNKGRAYESLLTKYTGWMAGAFLIISIILVFLLKKAV